MLWRIVQIFSVFVVSWLFGFVELWSMQVNAVELTALPEARHEARDLPG